MKRKPKSPFQPGARVRVVKPLFFDRCGYPLSLEAVMDELFQDGKCWDAIDAFLKSMGVAVLPGERHVSRAANEIARAVAYALLHQRGFGGRERRIFTMENPSMAGAEGTIRSVRFVKTGTYSPTTGYRLSFEGEYDVDPAYLMDEQTHRILRVRLERHGDWEIEADNVEIIT